MSFPAPSNEVGQVILNQNYGLCCSVSLVFFDYVITLPQEIDLIWSTKWTPGKGLFVFIRYVGLLAAAVSLYVRFGANVTPLSCTVATWCSLSSVYLVSVATGLVLALRTWAIWNRTRWCAALVGVVWLAASTGTIVYTVISLAGSSQYGNFDGLPGCMVADTPATADVVAKVYSFGVAYEPIIFIMTIIRGFRHLSNPSAMMKVLYRDAFCASVCMLTFAIIDLVLANSDSSLFLIFDLIGFAFSFIVPCRIILNVRQSTMDLSPWD
ncbi:hypothetical protein CALVIDRAFT_129211 [Calocera viscosa TUFC12733]|uniref:DUF6533 domain-containing protein n=1 Tax=Calocera viscosa (strain TUFC12733) TaxID=1330018 RepID=A0A167RTM4_CALVF|nr:hypothetical protein CALVIDRAFT_129211 [Calocera viscosa TUFC12733]